MPRRPPPPKTILSLRPEAFDGLRVPVSTTWLVADCMEFRGKQELWTRTRPEVLRSLRDEARVQSVESSNRIEGVTVDADRLRPLVLAGARPRDRSEQEIAGYRRALDWIFKQRRAAPPFDPRAIRHLHALSQSDEAHDAGTWKSRDNEIIEVTPHGRRVRFVPTPAKQTPAAIAGLSARYAEFAAGPVPELLIIATAIFDFLCIHPFRDANGRVSRLLTTLLLERHDFHVSRYVSLERLVEENKDEYYRVLAASSKGWAEGRNDLVPWWNFFLGIVRRAYAQLEGRVDSASNRGTGMDIVRSVILQQAAPFSLADLAALVPHVSTDLIKVVLQQLKKEGILRLSGRGRSAAWTLVDRR